MAKISELTNEQLLQQIEKYKKIWDKLHDERKKRIEAAGSDKGLEMAEARPVPAPVTAPAPPSSKAAASQEKQDVSPGQELYALSFDDKEIQEMAKERAAGGKASEEKQEEIGVTQLITLSQEQRKKLKKKA